MLRQLLLLLLLFTPALAARPVNVTNVGASEAKVARLQSQLEDAFQHVERRLGLRDDGRLELTIVGGARTFAEIARADGASLSAENVLGYAVPSRRRIVLNLSAMDERGLEPLGVLRHEIAHLVLGSALPAARPLWLEEGLAQWVEGIGLNALIEGGPGVLPEPDYTGLDDLSAALREDDRAGPAYGEARRVIELLARRHGEDKLRALLAALQKPGAELGPAFAAVTGEDLSQFEAAWLKEREEERPARMVACLGANWSWLLFGLAGLGTVGAVVVARRRRRNQLAQMELHERLYPSDPSWSYGDDEPDSYAPGQDTGRGRH